MDLSNLKAPQGANRSRKRLGRGPGSGVGKTAGKGHKGQKARAGGGIRRGFEGGQMPLQRRLPKRGFYNRFAREVVALNVRDLEKFFEDGDTVSIETLFERGLVPARKQDDGTVTLKADFLKILGDGEITKKLTVHAHKFSASASSKIEAAGGSVVTIEAPTKAEGDEAADA